MLHHYFQILKDIQVQFKKKDLKWTRMKTS